MCGDGEVRRLVKCEECGYPREEPVSGDVVSEVCPSCKKATYFMPGNRIDRLLYWWRSVKEKDQDIFAGFSREALHEVATRQQQLCYCCLSVLLLCGVFVLLAVAATEQALREPGSVNDYTPAMGIATLLLFAAQLGFVVLAHLLQKATKFPPSHVTTMTICAFLILCVGICIYHVMGSGASLESFFAVVVLVSALAYVWVAIPSSMVIAVLANWRATTLLRYRKMSIGLLGAYGDDWKDLSKEIAASRKAKMPSPQLAPSLLKQPAGNCHQRDTGLGSGQMAPRLGLQKKILAVGVSTMALMGLFPPWSFKTSYLSDSYSSSYSFVFSPPSSHNARVDITRLFVQWTVVAGVAIGAAYVVKTSKEEDDKKRSANPPAGQNSAPAVVSEAVSFCRACGKRLDGVTPERPFCPHCGDRAYAGT